MPGTSPANAFIYARLSDKDQSNYSIAQQEAETREYCNRHNLTIIKVFIDNGQSSYTFDRADFNRLEKELKTCRPQFIIVKHLDRFSRNMAEAMLKIRELLAMGIRVRDISEPLEMEDESQTTFILRTVKFMSAEIELHRIHERTRDGNYQAAMQGRHINMAPYGYENRRDEKNRAIIVINDEKAVIIRMMFREYLSGMPLKEVQRLANRYGFKLQGNGGARRVLSNHVYAGLIKVPAYKGQPEKVVKGLHTAIISEQDYWLAQEMLREKGSSSQNREEVPLRGVLHQANGRLYSACNSRGRAGVYYWYYMNQDTKKTFSANRLHNEFYNILDHLSIDKKSLQALRDNLTSRLEEYIRTSGERMINLEKQLALVKQKIEATEYRYLTAGNVSEKIYQKVIAELRGDMAKIYGEIASCNTNHQAYWDNLNTVLSGLTDIRTTFFSLPLGKKHQFINVVFCNDLGYWDDCYRTPALHPLFAHNLNMLNKKGLLQISSPVRNVLEISQGTGSEKFTEPEFFRSISQLFDILKLAI